MRHTAESLRIVPSLLPPKLGYQVSCLCLLPSSSKMSSFPGGPTVSHANRQLTGPAQTCLARPGLRLGLSAHRMCANLPHRRGTASGSYKETEFVPYMLSKNLMDLSAGVKKFLWGIMSDL